MGGEGGAFITLLGYLEKAIGSFPDRRRGNNCHYTVRDAALSAFSVFHIQFPSFLSHQQMMQESRGNNNAGTLFGVHEIPTDTHIRNLLDPLPPEYCFPVYTDVYAMLSVQGKLEQEYRTIFDTYLIALNGTWFHSSEQIHCDACSVKEHRGGRRTYFHSAITIDRSFYNSRFANIRKKTVKSSRFAHEIFTNAFPTEKRQPFCKYAARNRTFYQE